MIDSGREPDKQSKRAGCVYVEKNDGKLSWSNKPINCNQLTDAMCLR